VSALVGVNWSTGVTEPLPPKLHVSQLTAKLELQATDVTVPPPAPVAAAQSPGTAQRLPVTVP
jgi:hypothetical protein